MTVLGELTWPEAAERSARGDVLTVPVGSTEQHGPHLPLSTDTDLAVALCQSLAARRPDVVVAPPLSYGASGEHAGFAGTLSIGTQALERMLVELGRSAADTFRAMLLVSTHGGNAEAVNRAEQGLRGEPCDVLAWMPRWRGDAHAGHVETSLQLALGPARVHVESAETGAVEPIEQLMPALRTAGVRGVSTNGVLGDPTTADATAGNALFEQLSADLLAVVAEWAGKPGERS